MLAREVDRSVGRETPADDLQRLGEPVHRMCAGQPVRLDVHALTRTDAEDRGTLGQMRQCQRRLRDHHGVASGRFRDADPQLHPSRAGGQRAQQRLVLEKGVRARGPAGGPAELPIPQGTREQILEVVFHEEGVEAKQSGQRRQHANVAHRQVGRGIQAGRDPRVRHHVIPLPGFRSMAVKLVRSAEAQSPLLSQCFIRRSTRAQNEGRHYPAPGPWIFTRPPSWSARRGVRRVCRSRILRRRGRARPGAGR